MTVVFYKQTCGIHQVVLHYRFGNLAKVMIVWDICSALHGLVVLFLDVQLLPRVSSVSAGCQRHPFRSFARQAKKQGRWASLALALLR